MTEQPYATVLLVRHGSVDPRWKDRVHSWADMDISEAGRREVLKTAKEIRKFDPQLIFTSDLTRTEETGRILNQQLFVELEARRELRDWNVGEYIGTPVEEAK